MNNGLMPTYGYRPAISGASPNIRARSASRARLFAGGTYFRSRDLGQEGNNISVELIEWGSGSSMQGRLIVTNHNTERGENYVGPGTPRVLEQTLDWRERYTIENLTTTPTARKYSISLQIAPVLVEELGPYTWDTLLYVPNKLSAIVVPPASGMTPADVITFKARTRVYTLTRGPTGVNGELYGWLPGPLRTAVNANDPWIEMVPRSGQSVLSDGSLGPAPAVPFDVQDTGGDDAILSAFPPTFLQGGDGLPKSPDTERTGPTRSLVLLNQGEMQNGALGDVNKMYEWAGESSTAGSWKEY